MYKYCLLFLVLDCQSSWKIWFTVISNDERTYLLIFIVCVFSTFSVLCVLYQGKIPSYFPPIGNNMNKEWMNGGVCKGFVNDGHI